MKNSSLEQAKGSLKMKALRIALAIISTVAGSAFLFTLAPTSAYAQCAATAPTNLTATAGPRAGEVMLNWNPATNVHRYALVFGFTSGNYQFGALSIDGGPNTKYLVTHLNPGTRYFSQVWALCSDDGPATPSNEVSFVAPGAAVRRVDP